MISIIAAMTKQNRVIGKDGDLPWPRLHGDLPRFKKITSGHPVIMGRKTFLSFPKRPLPDRTNIVLTNLKPNPPFIETSWLKFRNNFTEAWKTAQESPGNEEVFVIGGAMVYEIALPFVDRLYLTIIDHEFEGDVFFPKVDFSKWREIERQEFPVTDQNLYAHTFVIYKRVYGHKK